MAVSITSKAITRYGVIRAFRLSANRDQLVLYPGANVGGPGDIADQLLPDEYKKLHITLASRGNNADLTLRQTFHPVVNLNTASQWEAVDGFGNGRVGSGSGRTGIRSAFIEGPVTGIIITTSADVDVVVSSLTEIPSSIDE